jgi:hypothetical protein
MTPGRQRRHPDIHGGRVVQQRPPRLDRRARAAPSRRSVRLLLASPEQAFDHMLPAGWITEVTDRFQYGRNWREGEQRFLVYHDKDNRSPYQARDFTPSLRVSVADPHRPARWSVQHMIVESGQHEMLQRMGNMMQSVIPGFLESLASSGTGDVLRTQFGDLLENF